MPINSKAQGTIEYLIIISLVIVIALFLAIILLNIQSNQSVFQNTNKLSTQTSSGWISISESIQSEDGNANIVLQNTSGDSITIIEVSTVSSRHPINKLLYSGQTSNIEFTLDEEDCPCSGGAETTTCNYNITYKNQFDINKTISYEKVIDCLVIPGPTVSLIYPLEDVYNSDEVMTYTYSYTVAPQRTITDCNLYIDGEYVQTINNPTNPDGFNYHYVLFPPDFVTLTWLVRCIDNTGDVGEREGYVQLIGND